MPAYVFQSCGMYGCPTEMLSLSFLAAVQVLSLGIHHISTKAGGSTTMPLMEMLSLSLASRSFPPMASLEPSCPGYRESPPSDAEATFMFCKVCGLPRK